MRKSALLGALFLLMAVLAHAQSGQLKPTEFSSLVVIQLRDFGREPIPKAKITVKSLRGVTYHIGKTDKLGIMECLLPLDQAVWISVEDSVNTSQLTVPNKPYSITRHTVYFNGRIGGKPTAVVASPSFNMMPPTDGLALINLEFMGMEGQPLAREAVTLTADGSKKTFVDSTDAQGHLQMRVPIGENYTMSLAYNARFDHFDFPAHGGSYTIRARYKYAGKKGIEEMRNARLADQAAYDAYLALSREEQLKVRDENGHKKIFRATPIEQAQPPFQVIAKNYGFDLAIAQASPIVSPCYVDGLLIAGAGWDNDELAAVDAVTGKPVWSVSLAESGISNIEGNDDVVVCATESCTIYALAAKTGKRLWSKWLATYVLSAPCIADGKVYIGYEDADGSRIVGGAAAGKPYTMACFDLYSGDILWQQWIKGEVMSSAVADDKHLYFNTFSGYSYVLDRANGSVVAEKQLYATSAPTPVGDMLCMSQRDAQYAFARERIATFDKLTLAPVKATGYQDAPYLDANSVRQTKFASAADAIGLNTGASGNPIAMTDNVGPASLIGTSAIFAVQSFEGSRALELSGKLYVAQGHVLRCLDAKSLVQVWEWQFPTSLSDDGGACISPPIAVNGHVVVACMDGALREFDPVSGRILTNYVTGAKHRLQPIAAKGYFYVPCVDGKLSVIKTGNAGVDKWYCWGGNASRTNVGMK